EDVSGTLVARLGQGRVIALVADRDLGHTGIEVDLLGEPARFPAGPAVLALRTGAPLLPVMSWYDKDRTHLEIQTALHVDSSLGFRDSVLALTQQFADALGQALREHPTDWHMLQRVWTAVVVPAPS
ncbi:MAG TPA: phosphatidylinositol mannoside acyltransferase, partial [Actinomycetes bacterium]|nr:phosphatidylinositol mannoside acyltransferase [Actinomycetes bacterium]